jgi:hypothetical protein
MDERVVNFQLVSRGMEVPATLSEEWQLLLKGLTVTDGEDGLMATVMVGPKEAAKRIFVLHYGTVQLSSRPPGAIVIRRGKEVGKTPLMLERVPTETTAVELRLSGYMPTNFAILAQEGLTTNYTVKLLSERYLASMKNAQQALDANEFDQARKSVAEAIASDSADSQAVVLLTEINQKADAWRRQQLEMKRLVTEETTRKQAAGLIAIPLLDPASIIRDCWNTPGKSDPSFTKPESIEVAKQKPITLPVWIGVDGQQLGEPICIFKLGQPGSAACANLNS